MAEGQDNGCLMIMMITMKEVGPIQLLIFRKFYEHQIFFHDNMADHVNRTSECKHINDIHLNQFRIFSHSSPHLFLTLIITMFQANDTVYSTVGTLVIGAITTIRSMNERPHHHFRDLQGTIDSLVGQPFRFFSRHHQI